MTANDGRDRLGPPEIEPLSEIAWHRVERGLFATLDCDASAPVRVPTARSRRPWLYAGAAAALAAAIALVVAWPGRAPGPAPGAVAEAPSRIVTQDAPTEVSVGDASIVIDAETALTIDGNGANGVLVMIERGGATFAVAPRAGRPPFVVQAGEVTVRVVGTRFSVSRSGDAASVDVTEGKVEVVSRGHRVMLRAGDAWSSRAVTDAARGVAPAELAAAPAEPPPAVAPAAEPPARTRPERTPRPSPKMAFERAAALEATDPRAALAEYRALARDKGPWAANALYAAGRLAAELGDRATAASLLRQYLRRFPRGANAADARTLLRTVAPVE